MTSPTESFTVCSTHRGIHDDADDHRQLAADAECAAPDLRSPGVPRHRVGGEDLQTGASPQPG